MYGADQRGGACANAVAVELQRQPGSEGRLVGLQKRCRIGVGQFDMTVADQTVGVAAQRNLAGQMAAGEMTVEIVESDFRRAKLHNALEIARS